MDELAAEVLTLATTDPGIDTARLTAAGNAIEITVIEGGSAYLPLKALAGHLENLTGADRIDTLRRLLAAAVETANAGGKEESWDVARFLALRPMLHSAIAFNGAARPLVGTEVAAGVAAAFVVDRTASSVYVTQDHLDDWGVTAQDVLEAAFDNLEHAPDPSRWEAKSGGRVYERVGTDDYTATRLFTPGWLARSGLPGTGATWFANPTRNVIMAGRVDNVAHALPQIAGVTRELWESAKVDAISPVVYTVARTGAITPLAVKRNPQAAGALRQNQVAQAVSVYGHQLRRREAPEGEHWPDIQVAKLGGREVTLTAWTGHSTNDLLPEAEYVMIPPVTSGILVPWIDFLTVVGNHIQREPGPVPARWRTCCTLTPEQLQQLADLTAAPSPL